MSNTKMSPRSPLPYFHSFNNYEEIRKTFLHYLQKDGYFLLRNSMSGAQYCISVVHNQEIKHMRIEQKNGTFLLRDIPFISLDKLVQYYKKNEIPNEEKIRHIRLLHPITHRRSPVSSDSRRRGSEGQVPPQSSGISGRLTTRAVSMPLKRDSKNFSHSLNNGRSSMPASIASRAPAALPMDAFLSQVEAGSSTIPPPEYCYDYAKLTDHLKEVKENVRLMDLEDAGELCKCGLLNADSKLPMGWTVHLSTEPETAGRVFFVSPNQHSAWELPSEVDSLLTSGQRLFIEGLKQNAPR